MSHSSLRSQYWRCPLLLMSSRASSARVTRSRWTSPQVSTVPPPCSSSTSVLLQLGTSCSHARDAGEAVPLDSVMGPLVVGEDGSLSRIANWAQLSEREREVAMRRVCARNKQRLEALRAAGQQHQPSQ